MAIVAVFCLATLPMGWWAGGLHARALDERLREPLLQEAIEIAQAIDPNLARSLTFSPSDAGSLAEARLRTQLRAYAELLQRGGIYTLALRDGQLVFGPESYPSDHPMASPLGTVYQRPSPEDYRVITEARAYVTGPETDEYGTFVSALAPVRDPRTGEVLFAIGIDVPADEWQQQVRKARMEPVLASGMVVLLALVSAATHWWRARVSKKDHGYWRHLEVTLMALWSLFVTTVATIMVGGIEADQRDHIFQMLSAAQVTSVRDEAERVRDHLGSLAGLFEGSEHVAPWEFSAFVLPMVREQPAQTYAWVPAMGHAEAHLLQSDAQFDSPEDAPIWEYGANGRRVPVPDRPQYYPVTYVEPIASNSGLLGYDLGSDPRLRAALEESMGSVLRTSASPMASQVPDNPWELWLLRAVNPMDGSASSARQRGFVLALVPVQSLLDTAMRSRGDDSSLLSIDVLYLGDSPNHTVLATHPAGHAETRMSSDGRYVVADNAPEYIVPLFLFGRPLALVYQPTPEFYALQPMRTTPVVACAGLVISAGLTSLVALLRRQAYTLERLVEVRTASLAESEAQHRALYDLALNPILVADLDGRYVDANDAALRFLECSREELIGRSVWDVTPPEDLARMREAHEPFDARRTVETTYQVGDRVKTLLLSVVPLSQRGRTVLYGIGQDITERKEDEARRLEMDRQLLQAQKLESLGVLAGGIAHDFNNLLAAILGNVELARLDLPPGAPARTSLDEAISASRRAADLTRQMLAYSGKGRFVLSALDLSSLVQENAHMLRVAIPRSAQLQLDLAPALPPIRADSGQIQQVVMNLMINAAEALGQEAGVVSLTTGHGYYGAEELQESRTVEKPAPGHYVWLSVEDTGCGMDDETLQRMFDPFFSSKGAGRGLGMSAVLGIVRGHQGAIWVESTLGQGTCVTVAFPALAAEAAVGAEQQPRSGNAHLSGTILVVDDEEVVRHLCCTVLERMGLAALPAANGEEACAIYAERADEIHAVLLDLTMPGMDGIATLEELRRINPQVRALLCSGFGEQAITERLSGSAPTGFVQKPFDMATLRDAIERTLQGA